MKSTKYLYDCSPADLPSMADGLFARIDRAKRLLGTLLEAPYMEQDTFRIKAVLDAIAHNTALLKGEI